VTTIPDFTPPEPSAFSIYGEEFHLLAAMPRSTMNALTEFQTYIGSLDGDLTSTGRASALLDSLYGLLPRLVVPEDRDRFTSLLEDEERPVGVQQLNALMMYAVEVVTGRPTQPPSDSSSGSTPAGASSTATASPEGST